MVHAHMYIIPIITCGYGSFIHSDLIVCSHSTAAAQLRAFRQAAQPDAIGLLGRLAWDAWSRILPNNSHVMWDMYIHISSYFALSLVFSFSSCLSLSLLFPSLSFLLLLSLYVYKIVYMKKYVCSPVFLWLPPCVLHQSHREAMGMTPPGRGRSTEPPHQGLSWNRHLNDVNDVVDHC